MLSGLLLLDKPSGMTSMEVVERIRKRFRVKAGHTGTLDPLASGLMLILIGEATKFSQFFTALDKAYWTKVKLGEITNTYDAEGELVESREVKTSCEEVSRQVKRLEGTISQLPPPFSAKWVDGKRAYEMARKGQKVELKPVRVTVYLAELFQCELPVIELFFEVSSGTYIRSLVHDLGLLLLCGAHVLELRRLRVGRFSVDRAVGLEDLMARQDLRDVLIDPGTALDFLPEFSLGNRLSEKVKKGSAIKLRENLNRTFVRLYSDGTFMGIGLIEGNQLRPFRLMQGL